MQDSWNMKKSEDSERNKSNLVKPGKSFLT